MWRTRAPLCLDFHGPEKLDNLRLLVPHRCFHGGLFLCRGVAPQLLLALLQGQGELEEARRQVEWFTMHATVN